MSTEKDSLGYRLAVPRRHTLAPGRAVPGERTHLPGSLRPWRRGPRRVRRPAGPQPRGGLPRRLRPGRGRCPVRLPLGL